MNLRYEPSVVSSFGFAKIMVDMCNPQNYTKDKFVFYAPLDSIWWPSTNNNQELQETLLFVSLFFLLLRNPQKYTQLQM